jgi:NAD(P) transhydrogenase subunit beta
MPVWIQLVFLACGVCFILALKGLSGPKNARKGNLIGAGAAVVACVVPFFWSSLHLHHIPLILAAIASSSRSNPKTSPSGLLSISIRSA